MLKETQTPRWMLASGELRKDAPFFVILGLLCGILQVISYRYFDKANWGSELLREHIAFNSLLLIVIFLWLIKALAEWLGAKREMPFMKALITHVSARAVAFASVAASIVAGVSISALLSGAYFYAGMFLVCCAYFVSLAEIAANPLIGQSKTYPFAVAIVIGLPFAFSFVP